MKLSFFKKVKYGFMELHRAYLEEFHLKLHLIIFMLVILLSFYFKLNRYEFIFIIIVSFLVIISEVINTLIEDTVDYISIKKNEKAKRIKDLGTGLVLLSAILAVIVGLIIFIPKL